MVTEVLRTFWVSDPFRCVLVDEKDRYGLQIFIRGEAFLKDSARTIEEAQQRADTLHAVFCPNDHAVMGK